jgi:hypothetical protein
LQFAVVPLCKSLTTVHPDVSELFKKRALGFLRKITHLDGTCDQSYPNEKHPKTFLDLVPLISLMFEPEDETSDMESLSTFLERSIDYAIKHEEDYAIASNHTAHDLFQYLTVWKLLRTEKYYSAARKCLNMIEKNTPESGFHLEYQGGDPGYQTRTLKYLIKSLSLLKPSERELCEELCVKSCSFLDKTVMPDGTIYSMFGSRNTALIYPSGIEYMAYKYPHKFSDLARRVRNAINNGLTPLPLHLEFDNFIRLFDDYLDAQQWFERNREIALQETRNEEFDLKDFGFKKIIMGDVAVYIHYKYGGACAVYKDDKLIAKDAGILIKDSSGDFWGTRNLVNHSETLHKSNNEIGIKTVLFKSCHQELTPFKMIVLRILNLTVLRINFFANFFRKLIVGKLIVGSGSRSCGTVERSIRIKNNRLLLADKLNLRFKPAKLFRVAYLYLFHMASSRYWNPVDKDLPFCEEISEEIHEGSFDLTRGIEF